MSVTLQNLINPAMRKAGLSKLPGTGPGTDKYNEAIGAMNRMLSSWGLDGLLIYKTSINRYSMSPLQSSYYIGPTGDWVAPRPLWIISADLVQTSTFPEIHLPMHIVRTGEEWAKVTLPDLQTAYPCYLYNDRGVADSLIRLWPIPAVNYDIELFTRDALKSDFTAITDEIDLPDGYEAGIVDNFTLELESLYPLQAVVSPQLRKNASIALKRIKALNLTSPPRISDADNLNQGSPTTVDNLTQRVGFFSGWQA